jgi:hypothetical protein
MEGVARVGNVVGPTRAYIQSWRNSQVSRGTGGTQPITVPRQVQSRINVVDGRTVYTPLRKSGHPVSAGFDHVVQGHFNRSLANNRSIFTISQNQLKTTLQLPNTVKTPATGIPGGQYVRVVNTGQVVGNTALKHGGRPTTWIRVYTDRMGNLITTYPVPAP